MGASAKSLADLFYAGAAKNPSAVALHKGEQTTTYATLIEQIGSTTNALQRLRLKTGMRVGLCAANHAAHLVTYLAILFGGFVWVPLNPKNGRRLNSIIAQQARADLIIVDRQSLDVGPAKGRVIVLEELKKEDGPFTPIHRRVEDLAAIKFTGGTSGQPKGVRQTHGNMLAVIENMQHFYNFTGDDCNLLVAPLTHGSSHYVLPILAVGGCHRFPQDNSTAAIIAAFRGGTSIAFMPPTAIYKLLQSGELAPEQFPALRHLTYSAAPMSPERIAQAQRAFGPRISTMYGQTEAPVSITALGPEEMTDPARQKTVGRACCNCAVRVVDAAGAEAAAGETGMIEVRGPIVMQGYLDDPALTRKTIRNGWLRTGDMGHMDELGYLTLTGRASEMINSGGFKIYPAEIESVLAQAPGVRECCVFAVPDDYWGERIEAIVTLERNAAIGSDEILAYVKKLSGSVRTPKVLHLADEIPRNAVGKVVRRDMPAFVQTLAE